MIRLINMLLRGLTLFSKFVLVVALARLLPPEQVGLYGLLAVTVMYALYFVGFDFYTYSTREFLKKPDSEWGCMIKSQTALWLLLYVLFMPLMALFFYFDWLPKELMLIFFVLLVLEHLAQEFNRFYVAISRQLLASVILFLRMGLWALCVIVLMVYEPQRRELWSVLVAWSLGGFSAVFLGVVFLLKLQAGGWSNKVDWSWVKKGITTSVLFLIASLSIRSVFTLDRYVFEAWNGLDVLAAYVLYIGIANALMSFLDAGLYSFSYPKLIEAFVQKDSRFFQKELVALLSLSVLLIVVYVLTAWAVVTPLLDFLDKPIYRDHVLLLPWFLLAISLLSLSMIPHYGLYAQHHDRVIVISHVFALLFFILILGLMSVIDRYFAVPAALCGSSLFLLIWKSHLLYKHSEPEYLPRLRWKKNYA